MEPIAIFTLLLVIVGAVQSWWMWRTVSDSKKALEQTQRAFVFVNSFVIDVEGDLVKFTPKWENSGTAPTRKMVNHTNWTAFEREPADDYVFSDLWAEGKSEGRTVNTPFFVGPKAITNGGTLEIPFEFIRRAAGGQVYLLIWGWTEYNDVFENTPRRRTEFCNQVIAKNIQVKDGKTNATITLPLNHRGNCTDEECRLALS